MPKYFCDCIELGNDVFSQQAVTGFFFQLIFRVGRLFRHEVPLSTKLFLTIITVFEGLFRRQNRELLQQKTNIRSCFICRQTPLAISPHDLSLFEVKKNLMPAAVSFSHSHLMLAPAGHTAAEMSLLVTCATLFLFPFLPDLTNCLTFQTGLLC